MGNPEFDHVESPVLESTTYRSSTPRALSADLFGDRLIWSWVYFVCNAG